MLYTIASYKFIALSDLSELRVLFFKKCTELALRGTILLSKEGINISLAGTEAAIIEFKNYLSANQLFADIKFHEIISQQSPFKRLKIKLKKEIITMGYSAVKPELARAPSISPAELKQWLDENRDVTLLDTRNDYEINFGTFVNAINLKLNQFNEFPEKSQTLSKEKPIVMFCTGGIRCEKASIYLLNEGFETVYQLDGGILNYFAEVGSDHYRDGCFIFDERVVLDANLQTMGVKQCQLCQARIQSAESHSC